MAYIKIPIWLIFKDHVLIVATESQRKRHVLIVATKSLRKRQYINDIESKRQQKWHVLIREKSNDNFGSSIVSQYENKGDGKGDSKKH